MKNTVTVHEADPSTTSRRNFLKLSGLTLAGTGLLLMGCSSDDDSGTPDDNQLPGVRNGVFDLGGGDFGVLTYAYALEQLEADFYYKAVNAGGFNSFTTEVKSVLTDLYHHETIHRDFFKAALSGALPNPETQLLPNLEFQYTGVDWNSEASVLATAKALEDTGVAAYNGAGKVIKTADYLVLAGKIVSVEARHAAAIRSLIGGDFRSFAGDDIINSNGLDLAKDPSDIVPTAKMFITTDFTAKYLP